MKTYSDQVVYLLGKHADGFDCVSLDQIVKIMKTSRTTLTRRLKDEGTTYRELKNLFFEKKGKDLLARSELSIEEIAYEVGYKDAASYMRAFKKRTGVTPSTFRRSHSSPRKYA